MAETRISDIVVPSVFNPYMLERTAAKSALVQAGIVARDASFDALAASGGTILSMPFWQDLTGADEVLSDSGALTVNAIPTETDYARLLMRGKAWGANDLAKALSGDDPMAAIGDLVGGYWSRAMQATLLKILEGIFGASSMATNVLDISSESGTDAVLDAETFIDALLKLGDARDGITGCLMHSAAVGHLAKLDLIDYIPGSEGSDGVKQFLGKTIIEDDGAPVAEGVYTSYLFGPGAIAWGEGSAPVPTETGRDQLSGYDYLINRRHMILHPRGVKWTEGSISGSSPTNAELATSSHWAKVYETKNVKIIKFNYRLAAAGS